MENLPKCQVVGILQNSGTTQEHNNRVYSVEGISPTLTAVSGGTHHIKIFDPSRYRVRKLTPTEYGRLQAFPVSAWKQVVSDSQAYKQFGNAVTVTVFEAIARKIAAAIYEREDLIMGAEKTMNTNETPESVQNTEENVSKEEKAETKTQEAERTAAISVPDLAEKVLTHLFEKTFLPGFAYDAANASLADYIESELEGLYIGEEPEDTRDWDAAEKAVRVAEIGIQELKKRLERGERTPELFNAIVNATR